MIVEDAAFCRGFLPTGSAAAELLSSFSLVLKLPLVLFGPVQSPLAQASVKTGLSDAISRANLYMEFFWLILLDFDPRFVVQAGADACFGETPTSLRRSDAIPEGTESVI
ncbi:hypothetical protein V6N13_047882 [Hibiscus sabdariffa]